MRERDHSFPYASFLYASRLFPICKHLYGFDMFGIYMFDTNMFDMYMFQTPFIFFNTHLYVLTPICMFDTHSHVRHDTFTCARSLPSYVRYRAAKTHRIPYLYRSFSAKVTYT